MQLIPEEVAYLRERGERLENKCANFYQDRYDHDNINGVNIPSMDDINEKGYQFYSNSLKDIHHLLTNNQFVWKRNFDKIDVGTGFFLCFDDDPEIERYVLTEKGVALSSSYKLIFLESDLCNAVKGKKDGDKITYQVSKTLRTISASIIKIDRVKSNYISFILETPLEYRLCSEESKKIRFLQNNDIKGYLKRYYITQSQRELAQEERKILSSRMDRYSAIRNNKLDFDVLQRTIAELPKDGTIGIGSHVELLLKDDNGNIFEKKFELINQAVTTELDCHYVERISPLGHAIYGKSESDEFEIGSNNNHYYGRILSVDNNYNLAKVKVL